MVLFIKMDFIFQSVAVSDFLVGDNSHKDRGCGFVLI